MFGYMEEINRVGVIDNDEMRELAFCLLRQAEARKQDPRKAFWLV